MLPEDKLSALNRELMKGFDIYFQLAQAAFSLISASRLLPQNIRLNPRLR